MLPKSKDDYYKWLPLASSVLAFSTVHRGPNDLDRVYLPVFFLFEENSRNDR